MHNDEWMDIKKGAEAPFLIQFIPRCAVSKYHALNLRVQAGSSQLFCKSPNVKDGGICVPAGD